MNSIKVIIKNSCLLFVLIFIILNHYKSKYSEIFLILGIISTISIFLDLTRKQKIGFVIFIVLVIFLLYIITGGNIKIS